MNFIVDDIALEDNSMEIDVNHQNGKFLKLKY